MVPDLHISDASRATGLSVDTIRYYERVGVLPGVQRRENGYRVYSPQHLETLRFARRLHDLGLGQADMAALVQIFHDGTCREMRETLLGSAAATLERVRSQKAELERIEAQLSQVVEGLGAVTADNQRISTLAPCGCVTLVESERALP